MKRETRGLRSAVLAMAAVLVLAAAPSAAQAPDAEERWLPFAGCWEPVPGDFRSGAREETPPALLCVRLPAAEAGVDLLSVEDGEVVNRQRVRADGQRHAVSREGCQGWEQGDFALRPGRVYLTSEYTCEGGIVRTSSTVLAIASPSEWVHVRAVRAGEEALTWVTRYREVPADRPDAAAVGDLTRDREMAVRSARIAATRSPTVEDVIEATAHLDPEAVSAWLVERDAPLDLDAAALERMADAGVPEDVIDMAVAVTYPDQFAVDRGEEADDRTYDRGRDAYYGFPYYGLPYYDPFFFAAGPYGLGYRYGYGFGFGRHGGFLGPTIIRIDSGSRDSGGRVLSGQGYRRGASSGGRRASPRSGGAAVSGGRAATGGSTSRSGSTGRKAKRKGGGGGS